MGMRVGYIKLDTHNDILEKTVMYCLGLGKKNKYT